MNKNNKFGSLLTETKRKFVMAKEKIESSSIDLSDLLFFFDEYYEDIMAIEVASKDNIEFIKDEAKAYVENVLFELESRKGILMAA